MSEKASHISNFMRRNQAAVGLVECVERDARVHQAVRRVLAAELRPHCLHATLEGGRLCLLTDSPVWASRLRFVAPELLVALGAQGTVATEVRVRIAPAAGQGSGMGGERAAARLSQATVAHLRVAAATMEDADLAAALLRLAGGGAGGGAQPAPVSGQETAKGRGA